MLTIPNSTKQTKPTMHSSGIRISRPSPTKTDRSFFCWFTASSYTGALSSAASVSFVMDFWACSTYSSSQYQPSHDPVPSHWNYNNKSRTLIKIITKMATKHNKTWQKNYSLRDPDTCRRCALGWDPSSSPCTPSQSSTHTCRTQWEGGPASVV